MASIYYNNHVRYFISKMWRAAYPVLLGVISAFLIVAGGSEPPIALIQGTVWESLLYKLHIGNSTVSGVGIGVFSGWTVWFFSVYIPEQKRRKIMKTHLAGAYRRFRINLLTIFLFSTREGANSVLIEKLQDHREFRKFFNHQRWQGVSIWLSERQDYLREIHLEMKIISQEAMHVRNNCNIQDMRVHAFLGGMSDMALEYQQINSKCDYEYRKSLLRFLWGLFAQWSFASGQHEKDPIQIMIDRI